VYNSGVDMRKIEIQWIASNASSVLTMKFELRNGAQIIIFPKPYQRIPQIMLAIYEIYMNNKGPINLTTQEV
jgi:hypothetical protein